MIKMIVALLRGTLSRLPSPTDTLLLVLATALMLTPGQCGAAASDSILKQMGEIPLGFEPNRGQAPADVQYLSTGLSANIRLHADSATLALPRRDRSGAAELKVAFLNGNSSSQPKVEEPLSGFTQSYLAGSDPSKWIVDLPRYRKIRYSQVWPGVDVLFYGNGHQLEYDFVVAPGADPSAIRYRFSGMESLSLDAEGNVTLATKAGSVMQRAPVLYQETEDGKSIVPGHIVVGAGNIAHFEIGPYDTQRPLIIDPLLVYSDPRLSSNPGPQSGLGIAVSSAGTAYVVGQTVLAPPPNTCVGATTPITSAFLFKLDAAGNGGALVLSGCDGDSAATAVALDSSNNVFVTGFTKASNFIFHSGGFKTSLGAPSDGFMVELAASNGLPLYSTYIGGTGNDNGNAIATDANGKVYIAGQTCASDFSPTTGPTYRGSCDAFAVKIDPTLTGAGSLIYSTYIGGSGADSGSGIAVDGSFNAYVSGSTTSSSASFSPSSPTGFSTSKTTTTNDGFVVKLNASGSAASYLTFFPNAPMNALTVGADGFVYTTGQVSGTGGGLSTNSVRQGYQLSPQGGLDAFLAKFDTSKGGVNSLLYSTYLGGAGDDIGYSVAVDQFGDAIVGGITGSSNFPSTNNTFLGTPHNLPDAFVTTVSTNISGVTSVPFSAMIGGDGSDQVRGVALDGMHNVYLTGTTGSSNFPPTTGQTGVGAFAAKLSSMVANGPPAPISVAPASGSGQSQTFAATYSADAAPITQAYIMVSGAISAAHSCFILYNVGSNNYQLMNDAGTAFSSPVSVGSGSAGNSQCTFSGTGAGSSSSSNNLTVNFPITFSAAYAGAQNVFLLAIDANGGNSGWQKLGTWTVTSTGGGGIPPGAVPVCNPSGSPCVVSLTPTNGSGLSGTFTGVFTHAGGASQHYLAYILFLPTPNVVFYTATGSCLVEYNRISNAMRLINDAGTNWLPGILGIPITQGGTLTNSHCTLDVTHSSAQINGTVMTVTAKVTFNSGFTGQLATFMQAFDVTGAYTGMTQFGNWKAAAGAQRPGPYVVGLSPTSGSGSATTLTFTAGHTSGVSSLSFVTMLISSVIVGGSPCQAFYFPATNTLNLVTDDGTAMVTPNGISPGTAGTLSNSRCSINTGTASRVIAGTNVMVSLPMTFNPGTFGGMKNVYVNAFDNFGFLSHWVTSGTWTVQ